MIKTKRLKIYPASNEQMEDLISKQTSLELKKAYREMLCSTLLHPDMRDWYALWMIELKDGTHIGELCFKGVDEFDACEIGYGVTDDYQGYGYATEAVTSVTDWAIKQDEINFITAEVEKDNTASIRVLEKSGFVLTDKVGEEGPIYKKVK